MADTYVEEFLAKQREKEAAERAERDRLNAEARVAWEQKIEADRLADRRKTEAALDAELEPRYRRQKAEWLVNNPGKTAADFDRLWAEHLRPVLAADLREARINLAVEELRASGKYRI
jgi:hypothetical protein